MSRSSDGHSSRPRSRAIAIQRNRRTGSNYEDMGDSTVYEIATWRMYNRIINHRQQREKDGASSSDEESVSASAGDHDEIPPSRKFVVSQPGSNGGLRMSTIPNQVTLPLDDGEDEGIFQLDL